MKNNFAACDALTPSGYAKNNAFLYWIFRGIWSSWQRKVNLDYEFQDSLISPDYVLALLPDEFYSVFLSLLLYSYSTCQHTYVRASSAIDSLFMAT